MALEHRYDIQVDWQGNLGSGTSGYRDYGRDVQITATGKSAVAGSADKPFRGDPTRWNPEELLLVALAQCHLLSYLHVAVAVGVVVTDYHDAAEATMQEDGQGGGAFTEAVLCPLVTVAAADMIEPARQAHQRAGELCFIANSVNFPVRHEPTIRVETVGGARYADDRGDNGETDGNPADGNTDGNPAAGTARPE